MTRLPVSISEPLMVLAGKAMPGERVLAVAGVLGAEASLEELSRATEAFREAMRSLGLLDETRSGQKVWDAWLKLSRHFLAPLVDGGALLSGRVMELRELPAAFQALGGLWERMVPEVEAFGQEETELTRLLTESPISSHVGTGFRARLLLLDRRAERIKVGVDLLRSGLLAAARRSLEEIAGALRAGPSVSKRAGVVEDQGDRSSEESR